MEILNYDAFFNIKDLHNSNQGEDQCHMKILNKINGSMANGTIANGKIQIF